MTVNVQRGFGKRRRRLARVWLDGLEVTHRSYYADSRRGVVRLMLQDMSGHFVIHPNMHDAVRYERRGKVKIELGARAL